MYATILTIVSIVLFVYAIVPVLVWRKNWVSVHPIFDEVDPDDPRLTDGTRTFFSEVTAQLAPLGFAHGPHLINSDCMPNLTSYIALFENHSAGDGAAAMLVVAHLPPAPPVYNYAVEFTTEFMNGDELNTGNSTDPGGLPRLPWQESHALPAMADLPTMYQVHRSLVAQRGSLAKKPRPVRARGAEFAQNVARQFQAHADRGVLRRDPDGRRFVYTWSGGYGVVWRQLPPFVQIRRRLHKRRARNLLKRLGMSPDYDKANYRERCARLQAGQPPPTQPVDVDEQGLSADGRLFVERSLGSAGATSCDTSGFADTQAPSGGRLRRGFMATVAGLISMAIGAVVYCAVAALTGYEVGLVALLVGLVVGGGVWLGSGRRGGRPYQLLAVLLTYLSLGASSLLLLADQVGQDTHSKPQHRESTSAPTSREGAPTSNATTQVSGRATPADPGDRMAPMVAVATLVIMVFVLPILIGVESPLSLLFVGIALYEAWRINRRRPTTGARPLA